jgi:hypothetical protein
VGDDLPGLTQEALEAKVSAYRERMRPLEADLARLRAERDVVLTELRRRERAMSRESRAGLKEQMRSGDLPTVSELVAALDSGSLEDYSYNLKTGGEVRLGFPGARVQTLTFTDGRQNTQARDFAEAAHYYAAGWELGSAGRPGVRVHFPGTRQERLVDASDVYARLRSSSPAE